jgi:SAM-dependent methyltransferase
VTTGLGPINPWMEERLLRYGQDGPVADVGCGRGWWLARMRHEGIDGIGFEPDTIRAADARHQSRRPVVAADARAIPLAAGSVGAVWCVHVLHHLADPAAALAEARRVLRPGGHLVLAETVDDHPAIRLARRIRPEWDGVAVAARFTAAGCLDMLEQGGFDVVEHRQHSVLSFAAWTLPVAPRRAWVAASRWEAALSARVAAFRRAEQHGAHLECVATRR